MAENERVLCLNNELQPDHFEVWVCERPAPGVKYEVLDETWYPGTGGELPERHIAKVQVK